MECTSAARSSPDEIGAFFLLRGEKDRRVSTRLDYREALLPRVKKQIGEIGSISIEKVESGYSARARVRMPDGREGRPRGFGFTKTEAEADLRSKVDRAVKKASDSLGDDATLSDLIDLWHRTDHRTARISKTTRAQYDRQAEQIRVIAGGLRVGELSTMRLERLLFSPGTGAPSAFKQRKVVLNKVVTSAIRRDVMATNPAQAIALPDYQPQVSESGEPIVLTEEQTQRLLVLAKEWGEARPKSGPNRTIPLYPILALAYGVSLRPGEIRGLRWKDCDFVRGTLAIRQSIVYEAGTGRRITKSPKTKSSVRTVFMPTWVRNALVAHRSRLDARSVDPVETVFASRNGEPLRDSSVNTALRKMAAGTEFEGIRGIGQVGRRTSATLIEDAMGPAAAAAHLGHSKITVTAKHYLAGKIERPDVSGALEGLGGVPQSSNPETDTDWD